MSDRVLRELPAAGRAASVRPIAKAQPFSRLVLIITALLLATWGVSRLNLYTPGSTLGYYLGVVGASMMLALLLYPLRKNLRFMQNWGSLSFWFRVHMLFGITGPVLILFHSTFHIGSLNAAVALTSMLLVAGSGVLGRFIYTRIHHGLYGRRATLQDQRARLAASESGIERAMIAGPAGEARLKQFEARALAPAGGFIAGTWKFSTLRVRRAWVFFFVARQMRQAIRTLAAQHGWSEAQRHGTLQRSRELLRQYLATVQDVAQFGTYERLMSWWHILHVPLVYMLAFSAVFHVIAVHMY
jgi:hypothetical protein